jgi:hypothetical protein
LFSRLAKEEMEARDYMKSKDFNQDDEAISPVDLPHFGKVDATEDVVKRFYSQWSYFITCKMFIWADRYNLAEVRLH